MRLVDFAAAHLHLPGVSGSPWTGLLRCSTNPSGSTEIRQLRSITSFHHLPSEHGSLWYSFGFCGWKSIYYNLLLSAAFHCHYAAGWLNQRNQKRSDSWSYSIPSFSHSSSLIFTECLHLLNDLYENAPLSIAPSRAPFCLSCIELNAWSHAADQNKTNVSQS